MIQLMLKFFRQTGDKSFLAGIPQAIRFIESQQLPSEWITKLGRRPLNEGEILVPRFIDIVTNKPLYVHRKGSNVVNGEYYTDSIPEGTIAHYSSFFTANPSALRKALQEAQALDTNQLRAQSPLKKAGHSGPLDYYYNQSNGPARYPYRPDVEQIISSLDNQGRWITIFRQISNPYKPIPADMPTQSDDRRYSQSMVGDEYDTSPFENHHVKGISTRTYIWNMVALINSIR